MARQVKGDDEQDVHTGARKFYCWTKRTGACKKVKRRSNRRERREGKTQARKEATA